MKYYEVYIVRDDEELHPSIRVREYSFQYREHAEDFVYNIKNMLFDASQDAECYIKESVISPFVPNDKFSIKDFAEDVVRRDLS